MPNKDESPAYIDIREDDLRSLSVEVLDTLLLDHTTGKNIFWATHDYEALGSEYDYHSEILPHLITGENGMVIRPRVLKSKEKQTDRVKDMAEVFTPSWVVKMMVDNVDVAIDTRCLELTCGEAPFLVSRYDATTGEPIAINERIGMLDRKLHLINVQQLNDEEWLTQVRLAFQSTYGYEWQGDSLLLARENLFYTFIDYYEERFGNKPDVQLLQDIAEIISWNLWQMDGLAYRIPREKKIEPQAQLSLFDDAPVEAPPPLCKIMDWKKGKAIKVIDIKRGKTKNQNNMKFDVIIGNPPYQEETISESTRKPPVFNFFMDEAYKCADKVELITPARFLFKAGYTPKVWDDKMLNDEHLKVVHYESISDNVFKNTDIKGGVVITYRDANKILGPIGTFTKYPLLNDILIKVISKNPASIQEIFSVPLSFGLSQIMISENPQLLDRLRTSAFSKLSEVFYDEMPLDGHDYIKMIGLEGKERVKKYVRRDYIKDKSNTLDKWKLLLPEASGTGKLGETLGKTLIAEPGEAFTQTFICIGRTDNKEEVYNIEKYVKAKFVRALIGVIKVTQHTHKGTWKYVPLQDFTSNSDIDWSKSIAEIDEQLFDKYGLDEQERNFIRTKVKEMS